MLSLVCWYYKLKFRYLPVQSVVLKIKENITINNFVQNWNHKYNFAKKNFFEDYYSDTKSFILHYPVNNAKIIGCKTSSIQKC